MQSRAAEGSVGELRKFFDVILARADQLGHAGENHAGGDAGTTQTRRRNLPRRRFCHHSIIDGGCGVTSPRGHRMRSG